MTDRIMSTADVMGRTTLGRTTIWRLEKAGEFPRRRVIVGQRVGWLESEVTEWLRSRPTAEPGEAA